MDGKFLPRNNRSWLSRLLTLLVLGLGLNYTQAQSLKFNGTSQYGRVNHAPELRLQSFTIEMWIKPEATGTTSSDGSGSGGILSAIPLLTKGVAENESAAIDVNYYLGIRSTDMRLGADFEDNATSANHPAFSNTAIQMCKWQHVAASYDATIGQWKIYIDGTLDATLNLSSAFIPQNLSTVNLAIGSGLNSTNANAGYFNGKMDEIRIWNVVRTDAEISGNKDLEITSAAPGLVARYSLNEGTGTLANTSVPAASNLNASLFNTPTWTNQFLAKSALDFDGVNDYVTFGNNAALGLTNYTLEAWIKIEGPGALHASTGSGGLANVVPIVTKGRDQADGSNVDMNYYMGIKSTGTNYNIVADFEEGASPGGTPGLNHPIQGSINIPQNIWTHLACTYDGTDLKLYVNGQLDATLNVGRPVQSGSIQHAGLGTAINSTGGTAGFFQGRMDEVRIWNTARTSAQIQANYTLEIPSASGLVGRWDMNEGCAAINNTAGTVINGTVNGAIWVPINFDLPPLQPTSISPANGQISVSGNQVSMTVNDPEAKSMTVKLYGRPKATGGAIPNFTIIALPDTQNYTEEPQGVGGAGGGHNGLFKAQTQWIKDRRVDSNIVFVVQLGDCTQHGDANEIEWKRADTAIKTLENPSVPIPHGIPYSICVGNHDQGNAAGSPTATTNFYNQYFGEARFSGRPYYGGHFGTNNDNHYELFSAGGIEFIHISIEYNNNSGTTNQTILQSVLDWADGLLKTHSNRKGILSSHWIMELGTGGNFGGPGQKIYDELKDNPNLIFLLSGHIHGEGRRTDTYNGSVVHTVLSDYQARPNGGNGLLRIMQFRPSENLVTFRTYSPTINGGAGGFETDADSQFSLPVNLSNQSFSLIGTNLNVPSGSVTNFSWPNLQPLTTYEWYVTIEDNENLITSGIFEFTTAVTLPLTLLNFKAVNEKNEVKLEWATTDEVNVREFVVERSVNGSSFASIGKVNARNGNGIQHYDLADVTPVAGKSWYRLKMIDADEKFTYSKVESINRSKSGKFDIIPNPTVHNEIRIIGLANTNEQVIIKVYDLSGRLHLMRNVVANGQDIVLKHQLMPGMYNVECIRKSVKENKQIIVR